MLQVFEPWWVSCDLWYENAAQKAAKEYDVPHVFSDSAKMLSELPELDGISIITPNRTHRPLAVQVLQAGKHVFCEKPPALNASEVEEMKLAAESAGKTLMFNFNNRARPESYALRKYIEAGDVGMTSGSSQMDSPNVNSICGWFTNKEMSGWTIDWSFAYGWFSSLLYGLPQSQSCACSNFQWFYWRYGFKGPWGFLMLQKGLRSRKCSYGFVRFQTAGFELPNFMGWDEQTRRSSVTFQGKAGGKIRRIFGTDGLDETAVDDCELYVQEHGRSVNRSIITETNEDMGRIRSAENFVRSINQEEKPLNTPDQALSLMKIIDATYQSANSGEPVSIV